MEIQELCDNIDKYLDNKTLVNYYQYNQNAYVIKVSIPYATECWIITKKQLERMIESTEYCDNIYKYMLKNYRRFFE